MNNPQPVINTTQFNNPQLPIGVFDSGVGGLTVLRELEALLPKESFLYLGDMARLPYGTKSADIITRYTQQAAQFLINHNIKLLVIACNTASATALPTLQTTFPHIPIVGVLQPGAEAAIEATKNGQIAVIATEATVASGGYQNAIKKLRPNAKIIAQSCNLLVALAEEGWADNPVTKTVAHHYLQSLLLEQPEFKPDCLVLACTHFPVVLQSIKNALDELVQSPITIVDSAAATATAVKQILKQHGLLNGNYPKSPIKFMITDAPDRFIKTAINFLGRPIEPIQVTLVDL